MAVTQKQNNAGFTVVELLVAMSVFSAVTAFAVAIFIQGMRSQRDLTEQITVNNEMSLVLEQMAREMRTGSFFSSSDGGSEVSFEDESGSTVTYRLVLSGTDGVPERRIFRASSPRGIPGSNIEAPFTGKDVLIENLKFFVLKPGLCDPWRVTIFMKVKPMFSRREAMPIQTTVSSRVLPVDLNRDDDGDHMNDFAMCRERLLREGS